MQACVPLLCIALRVIPPATRAVCQSDLHACPIVLVSSSCTRAKRKRNRPWAEDVGTLFFWEIKLSISDRMLCCQHRSCEQTSIQKRSGDPNPQYFSKSTAVEMGGVLPYKWEAHCSTNGRRIAGFPFLRSLEARKVRRYKWGAHCRTNWRCTAVLFRQVVGVGVSETLPKHVEVLKWVKTCFKLKSNTHTHTLDDPIRANHLRAPKLKPLSCESHFGAQEIAGLRRFARITRTLWK